jgi:hypothetical protein
MVTAGRIIGPIWGGAAFGRIDPGAPFAIAGALMGLALSIFLVLRRTLLSHTREGFVEPGPAGPRR